MQRLLFPYCLLFAALPIAAMQAQEESDFSPLSPDGRFSFVAFSSDEVSAGKPAFGIIEQSSGELVSDPAEELGDPSRPEETILWSPDSLRYALTTRVGTRHLDTYLYGWDGKAFRKLKWEGNGELESSADAQVAAEMKRLGFTDAASRGQTIAGDALAERWIDPDRLVLTRVEEVTIGEGDKHEVVGGVARAMVRWDEEKQAFTIERELPVAASWPVEMEEVAGFEVVQTPADGDQSNLKNIEVRHLGTGEVMKFTADGWMNAPTVCAAENGWPQIELHSHGPEEFVWRKLYRVMDGAYRCFRIDELTRLSFQAPDGAPLVEISPSYSLYLIRSRRPVSGDLDSFESFQIETPSPDGAFRVVSSYSPQYLNRVEIAGPESGSEPTIIYDFESGEGSVNSVSKVLWRPDSGAFAFYLNEGPRVGSTHVYQLNDGAWSEAPLPDINYDFLKPIQESGDGWRRQFESPLCWKGNKALVLELEGFFSGEETTDYRAHVTIHWNEKGEPELSPVTSMNELVP